MLTANFQENISLVDIDFFTKSNILRRANQILCSHPDFATLRILIFADFSDFSDKSTNK